MPLIYLPILNLKSALLQSRSAPAPSAYKILGVAFGKTEIHSSFGLRDCSVEVSTNLDSSDYDYEDEHEQGDHNTSTHHDTSICSLIRRRNVL
ncbi:MAG: hypothetical protein DMF20_00480 [Verrucomicrobia bacterium]|nr:MAG: hypothetical protein DMF20_00480 [Verrucomicrobiota bacterium]